MALKVEVFRMLDHIHSLCMECGDAGELDAVILEMKARLEVPLRVAVVGGIKVGKSTFMNALMGADILCTGVLETTYTVCWFRYGEQPGITICFRDGSQQDASLSELRKWSARAGEEDNERMDGVKYLIIYYPSEVLRTMEFIDTPGLDASYGKDSGNTLDFLSIRGSEDTIYEAGMADAVLYAFCRTKDKDDDEILQAFHKGKGSSISPINSIGLLTKVDVTGGWDVFSEKSPTEAARTVTDSLLKNESIKKLLFSILPVCAGVCEGYAQLVASDWEVLRQLAGADLMELQELLFDAENFISGATGNAYGDADSRRRLLGLLGQYGILEISTLLQAGEVPEDIGGILSEVSGMQAVRDMLVRHFGNRTFLIKTQYIFNHLRALARQIRESPEGSARLKEICKQMTDQIDGLVVSVQSLKELKVLQAYYNGQLHFSDEEEKQDFLSIMGEFGRSAENRLGVREGLTIKELACRARQKAAAWHGRAGDWMRPRAYAEAASIAARSYEQMLYHLNALSEE
ncbi:MAG: dynamin family protein [Acetatifactor sp.]|nr:dynamin family protein [Acetatifactor sp.]